MFKFIYKNGLKKKRGKIDILDVGCAAGEFLYIKKENLS